MHHAQRLSEIFGEIDVSKYNRDGIRGKIILQQLRRERQQ